MHKLKRFFFLGGWGVVVERNFADPFSSVLGLNYLELSVSRGLK